MGLNMRCLIVWEKEMSSVSYRFNNQSNAVCIKRPQKGFDLKVPNMTRPQRTSIPSLSLCVKCFPMENYLITRCGRLLEREAQPSKPSLRSPSSSSSAHKAWKGCVLVVLGKSAKAYYVCAAMLVSSSPPPLFILHINWIVDEKKLMEGDVCVCVLGKKITVKSSILKYMSSTSSLVGVLNAFIMKKWKHSIPLYVYFSLTW